RLASGFLAHLPDESVVIKMEQRRCSHHTGENAFDGLDADTRFEIAERSVGEDQPNIKTNQRATAPEHETHESADRAVRLDSLTIINPNQREILDIVKDFEQRHADENAGYDVIAVPPKRYARDEKHELHRTCSVSPNPCPDVICQEQSCNCQRYRQQ